MKWFLSVLRNRYFLATVGFLIAVGLILALGATFEWSWTIRLLAIIGVLLLTILLVVVSFLRANRSADRIERSIRQQAEQQLMSARPDRRSEIEEMQRQLNQAIERLKQSKLGRGKSGRNALYALPWYLFIGPPGSGKTTAIANSGLNFPLGTDRVRGVGGTRNCDWFFTDQAILLDTAGRYMTEEEDTEEWYAFLDTLKAQRPGQPVNGAIVGISMSDLLNASRDEIEWHADNIRRRVDELVGRLGVKFPVYLVFTKIDLLQGFIEFFGELTRREREQVWGATFSKDQQASELRTVFEEEYDRLYDQLINRRAARLSRPMKRAERQKVYAFPLQFELAKDRLAQFVSRLFQPNPYQESPVFRGFYFTSGTQEGVPLDQVIQAIAQQFDLPAAYDDDFGVQSEVKSYFLKDLFTDVIVPDQYMVQRTSKARRQGSLMRVGVMAASLVFLLLFTLGISQAFVRSRADLGTAKEAAADAARIQWGNPADAPQNFAGMAQLRQEIDALDEVPWLSLGLSRRSAVLEPTEQLYLEKTRSFVQEHVLQPLEQRLRAVPGGSLEGAERDQLYSDLKAYLLLTEETARLEDEGLRTFLNRHLTQVATSQLEPRAQAATRGELQARVSQLDSTFVTALHAGVLQPFGADDGAIARARQVVIEPLNINSIYNRLRQTGRDQLPPYTLADAVPPQSRNLFTGDPEVSGFFTKEGWNGFVKDALERESEDPTRDDWVTGRSAEEIPDELRNSERVLEQLTERYYADYANEWLRFLRAVRVNGFGNMREAARAMTELSDPYESPLVYLLARTTAQTQFQNELLGQLGEAAQEGLIRRGRQQANRLLGREAAGVDVGSEQNLHPIDRRFQWLHALEATQAQSGGAASELYQAFEGMREVSSALEEMAGDDAKAAEFAASVLSENGGLMADEQRRVRSALRGFDPEVRGNLFDAPIVQAWSSVLGVAQGYLNSRWRSVVYEPFQARFQGQYPFDPTSSLDAPIADVEAFFNPESGAVAAFVETELAPYLGRDLSPRRWEGRGIRLSPGAQQAVERSRSIGRDLFSNGAMRVDFEVQPEVPERSPDAPPVDQVTINIHGTEDVYGLGSYRPWTPVSWPGPSGALVSVSTQQRDLPPKTFDGSWALFRMLEAARVTRQSQAAYELRWTFEEPNRWRITALYNLRTRSASNPFNDPRSFFSFRPPASLN